MSNGWKIFIDPGHGGTDPGAMANGYKEKDINLPGALLLEKELLRCGFETEMSRRDDSSLGVTERGEIAAKHGCSFVFSYHFNANNGQARGTEAIYSFGSDFSKRISQYIVDHCSDVGTIKRTAYTRESDNSPGHNWYGVLRGAEPNLGGVIAEGMFLDNVEDAKLLSQPDFLQKLAVLYCKAICYGYGVNYVPENVIIPPIETIDYKAKYEASETKRFGLINDMELLIKKWR